MDPEVDDPRLLTLAGAIASDDERAFPPAGENTTELDPAILRELQVLHDIASFHQARAREEGQEPPRQWGKFDIIEQVGRGAFGAVYRAYDSSLQQEIALKLLPSSVGDRRIDATRILREARMLARVRHPNVVTVFGVDEAQDRVGLWMELVKGRTLDEVVRTNGPFSAREAAIIGLDLCRAVAAVHKAGLLHGDIKAHNVMREEGGRIVLMDFGAGRDLHGHSGDDFAGTPVYLAPEVFEGQPRTTSADVYSLGILLYYLVAGRYPIAGATRSAIARTHQRLERTSLRDLRSDLPDAFVECVDRATDRDPRRRYDSVGAFGDALARSLGLPDGDWTREVPSSTVPWTRMPGRWLMLGLAIVVLAGGPMLWFSTRRAAPTPTPAPAVLSGGATTPQSYRVAAALHRMTAAGPQRLVSGDRLAPGDRLFLDVEASVPAYVYVINEDDRGESYLLFPLPGHQVSNPLAASTKVRLPGVVGGQDTFWQVTSAGGREHFLIFASPERLTAIESTLASLPSPEAGRPVVSARLPTETAGLLRGVGGLSAAPPGSPAASRLSAQFTTPLAPSEETTNGVWVRQLTLQNPIP